MAGVKGKSGGARPGTGGAMPNSGGSRPGAGRKKKSASNERAVSVEMEAQPHGGKLKRQKSTPVTMEPTDMLTLLQNVALGITDATALQVRAAIAAVQYTHMKKGDGGKKEQQLDAAKDASKGRFAPKVPPRMVVNNR